MLVGALDRSRSGAATTVVVGGEAGIGKSRLVTALAERARLAGWLVLIGGCAPIADNLLPYGAIGDLFRDAAAQLGVDELRRRLGPFAQVLDVMAPDLTESVAAIDAVCPPGLLLLGAIRRLAETTPTVVVTEDVHWADPSTLASLVLCTRSLGSASVVWIATYRSDQVESCADVVAQIGRAGALDLQLGPLSRDETGAQIASIRGSPQSATLVDRIASRSEGNPLFTEELLAADATTPALPDSLRQLLLRPLAELPDPGRRVLATAALGGRVVDHRLVARAADVTADELSDVIRHAVDHHILVAGTTSYAFRHALVREAIASTLLPGERVDVHRRLAEALADDPSLGAGRGPAISAELAHHWRGAGDLGKALTAHLQAGTAAEAFHAMDEAYRHFEAAVELWDRVPPETQADVGITVAALYERAASAACLSGRAERAVALVDEALGRREVHDHGPTAGLLYERLGRYLWVARADEQLVVAMYERAVAKVPATPSPQRARTLAGLGQILMLLGHYRRSVGVCEEALAIAVRVDARGDEGHVRNTLGVDLANLDRLDEGIAHLRQALAIAHETGDVEDLHRAHINLAATLTSGPRLAEARAVAAEGLELTRRHGVLYTQGAYAVSMLADVLYFEGRWDEAEELLRQAPSASGFPVATVEVRRVAAQIASARGQVAAAEQLLAPSDSEGTARGDKGTRARLAAARAEHLVLHGRASDALEELAGAWVDLAATDERHLLAQLAAIGLSAVGTGQLPPGWLDRLDGAARRSGGSVAVPPVVAAYLAQARAERARLAGRNGAESWAGAGDRWLALGRPYPAAWCRLREAEAHLAARGERQRAQQALHEAAATATALAAGPLRRAVLDVARRARLRLADGVERRSSDDHDLSSRELEVLALVAEGCTDRQIAETLFISVRTVGAHVSHILTKLGVPNRAAAGAASRRVGFVPVNT